MRALGRSLLVIAFLTIRMVSLRRTKACVACHMEEEVLSPMLEKVSKARTSAPEKAVECAAASKLKGRRIQMGTPCK